MPAQPYEGGDVMSFRARANEWFGLGVQTDVTNMSRYAGGALRFRMRTTTPATFKIGISTSFGDSRVDFTSGGQNYGLVRDGNWHQVTVPFDAFYDLDLHAVRQMFMVVADPHGSDVEFAIDNVHYESPYRSSGERAGPAGALAYRGGGRPSGTGMSKCSTASRVPSFV